jgi:ABC-type Fe3+-hydroxamate transport system substrate-binding protein
MNIQDQSFTSLLCKLQDIQHVCSGRSFSRQEMSFHTFLLFNEGEGDTVIDGITYPLYQQKGFMLAPGAVMKLNMSSGAPADYYIIRFLALQPSGEPDGYIPAQTIGPHEWIISHFRFVMDMVEEIEKKHHCDSVWDQMKANILFQEMLMSLFEHANRDQKPDLQQAVTLALHYMEQHYASDITRDKLAELAGMSPDYFSRVFKKMTSKSPMEYLTDIRINHAKQALVLTRDSFRSIAHGAGFSDEFYFSRKFKAATGRSPSAYVNTIRYSDKIASLKHLLTGHLVALGIEPYAAVINKAYPVTAGFRNTISIGEVKPDLEKLMSARPDLILTCEFRDFEKSQKEKMYEQIAPTVTLPFFQGWRTHFQSIARIVGKDAEAVEWLERYEAKAATISRKLKQKLGGETILVVGIGDQKMCVYGQRNVGTVLYGDLKLAMPAGVEDIAHYREVTVSELADFNADRIILTCYRHNGTACMEQAIQQECIALWRSPEWRGLKAVQNGAVHHLCDSGHLYTCYTPLSHDLFLDKSVELLLSDSSK